MYESFLSLHADGESCDPAEKIISFTERYRINVRPAKVLDFLREKDGAAQKEIAAACHIEPASLTTILNGMEEKGLIRRKSLNGNRRSWHIFLTDRGKEMVEAVDKGFEELEDQAFSGISVEEQESFLKTFEKMYHNMTTLEEQKHDRTN